MFKSTKSWIYQWSFFKDGSDAARRSIYRVIYKEQQKNDTTCHLMSTSIHISVDANIGINMLSTCCGLSFLKEALSYQKAVYLQLSDILCAYLGTQTREHPCTGKCIYARVRRHYSTCRKYAQCSTLTLQHEQLLNTHALFMTASVSYICSSVSRCEGQYACDQPTTFSVHCLALGLYLSKVS